MVLAVIIQIGFIHFTYVVGAESYTLLYELKDQPP